MKRRFVSLGLVGVTFVFMCVGVAGALRGRRGQEIAFQCGGFVGVLCASLVLYSYWRVPALRAHPRPLMMRGRGVLCGRTILSRKGPRKGETAPTRAGAGTGAARTWASPCST